MRATRHTIGIAVLVASLLGCGGSLNTNGKDGAAPTGTCAALGACECMAAGDHCAARTEACWCPSECNPNIECICGGGRFLGCEDNAVVTSCDTQLSRVKSMCTGMPTPGLVDSLCLSNPACVAQCLSALTTTQSCRQFDCRFCAAVCDCVVPLPPNPLADCLEACNVAPAPPR